MLTARACLRLHPVRGFSTLGVPDYHQTALKGSCVKDKVVTVFGATALLGTPVVESLFAAGAAALVLPYRAGSDGDRRMQRLVNLQPAVDMGCGNRVVPVPIDFRDKSHLKQVCSKSQVVVNLIGRDWNETKDGGFIDWSLYDLQTHLAQEIARAASEAGAEKHLYCSGLAANPNCITDWGKTKWLGEQAATAANAKTTNFRTSAFLGDGDREFCYYAMEAAKYGAVWMPLKGESKKQHLYIYDVAAALVKSLEHPGELIKVAGRRTDKNELASFAFELIGKTPNVIDMDETVAKRIAAAQDLNQTAGSEGTDMMLLRYYVDIILPEAEGQGNYLDFGLTTTPWDIAHTFPTIQKLKAAVDAAKGNLVGNADDIYVPATVGFKK